MIKTEILQGGKLIRYYTDSHNTGLLQTDTGIEYPEAIDPNPSIHRYKEIPMEPVQGPEQETQEQARAYRILMGLED